MEIVAVSISKLKDVNKGAIVSGVKRDTCNACGGVTGTTGLDAISRRRLEEMER